MESKMMNYESYDIRLKGDSPFIDLTDRTKTRAL